MDTQALSIRDRIIGTISRRLLTGFLILLAVSVGIMLLQSRSMDLTRLAVAVVAAEVGVGAWLGYSMLTNPLGGYYLRRIRRSGVSMSPRRPDDSSSGLAEALGLAGFTPAATITDPDTGEEIDVLTSPDALITIMVERTSDAVSAVSRLSDGRLLVTTDLMIVPSAMLLVNIVPSKGGRQLVAAHARLAGGLAERGLYPVRSSAEVSVELLKLETQGLVALGPVAGAFCGLAGGNKPYRLMVSPSPREVLALGMRHRHSPADTPRPQMMVRSTSITSTDSRLAPSAL